MGDRTDVDRRRPPARKRLLKTGKILLGAHAVPCTVRNLSETGACLQIQTTAGLPSKFRFVMEGLPPQQCKIIWRDDTKVGVNFVGE